MFIFAKVVNILAMQTFVKMSVRIVELPLRHAFVIAHGRRTVQRNVIVSLADGSHSGYGEVAPVPYYGVTAEGIAEALEKSRSSIEGTAFTDPPQFWREMFIALGGNRFALCAIDEAAHDLWGKRLGNRVFELWGLPQVDRPLSNYTIGIDTIDRMLAKMNEFPGWPIYKIKLGTAADVGIIRQLRQKSDAVFRVDANTAWSAGEAIENSKLLRPLGVEFIEQPLKIDDWDGMRRVFQESALPVIADESCVVEDDIEKCAGCFHGVNVKLTKAGGLTPAKKMAIRARELGLKVMAGCMTESTVGISSIAQLLPLLDYVDLDGAMLLGKDIADGVRLDMGRVVFPKTNGCGAELYESDFFSTDNQKNAI